MSTFSFATFLWAHDKKKSRNFTGLPPCLYIGGGNCGAFSVVFFIP
jgi:hypothetical protein